MRWTIAQLAEALSVSPPSGLDALATVTGASIDSRTIRPGELFIAIRGPRHDGHGFVASVLEAGATAAVVERARLADYAPLVRAKLFAVDETLKALQQLGARACEVWRRQRPGRMVGAVAGSVGKTTTKEIFAALLGARHRVLKTQGNLNNEYGLPLTLLKLDERHDAAVVELGMSHRGELAALTHIASPNVGVVTRVAVEHLEFFASVDEIALAERELIENLPWPQATAVLNADDERVARFAEVARGSMIRFGINAQAEFRAESIEDRGLEGSAFDFVSREGRARLELPLIGRHNVMNALGALAAASVWGIGAAEARRVFPSLVPADKRGEVVRYEEGFSVINDCYNSSPEALNSMTQLLAATPGYQRRILAAGEMLELGPSSAELHRECGRRAVQLEENAGKIDWIFGVHGHAADLLQAAVEAGHPRARAKVFANSQDAAKFVERFVQPGDLLLLKGSRGVKMERILEALDGRHKRVNAKAAEPLETATKRPR
ncbi:MAG: UDP-N-acetylmuramoyl-tripeptide--D-alanyl-D-alanine ligase [Candidatus Acidiferrales bacterium]